MIWSRPTFPSLSVAARLIVCRMGLTLELVNRAVIVVPSPREIRLHQRTTEAPCQTNFRLLDQLPSYEGHGISRQKSDPEAGDRICAVGMPGPVTTGLMRIAV